MIQAFEPKMYKMRKGSQQSDQVPQAWVGEPVGEAIPLKRPDPPKCEVRSMVQKCRAYVGLRNNCV